MIEIGHDAPGCNLCFWVPQCESWDLYPMGSCHSSPYASFTIHINILDLATLLVFILLNIFFTLTLFRFFIRLFVAWLLQYSGYESSNKEKGKLLASCSCRQQRTFISCFTRWSVSPLWALCYQFSERWHAYKQTRVPEALMEECVWMFAWR